MVVGPAIKYIWANYKGIAKEKVKEYLPGPFKKLVEWW